MDAAGLPGPARGGADEVAELHRGLVVPGPRLGVELRRGAQHRQAHRCQVAAALVLGEAGRDRRFADQPDLPRRVAEGAQIGAGAAEAGDRRLVVRAPAGGEREGRGDGEEGDGAAHRPPILWRLSRRGRRRARLSRRGSRARPAGRSRRLPADPWAAPRAGGCGSAAAWCRRSAASPGRPRPIPRVRTWAPPRVPRRGGGGGRSRVRRRRRSRPSGRAGRGGPVSAPPRGRVG